MIALLTEHLGIPKSAVTLVAGGMARLKTVQIDGNPTDLAARL